MRVLSRAWAMLVKSLDEVGRAPNAMMAAEMAVIRLTHVADLPTPEDLVRRLRDAPVDAALRRTRRRRPEQPLRLLRTRHCRLRPGAGRETR